MFLLMKLIVRFFKSRYYCNDKNLFEKSYLLTSKDDIKQVLKEAFEVANTGEKGPVVVAMPRNILEAKYAPKVTKELHKRKKLHLRHLILKGLLNLLMLQNHH